MVGSPTVRTKEYRDISTLHNWQHNPRSMTKDGLDRLIKQIKKLGVYKPLLITEDGTVLGGNMRLQALRELGQKEVWVSVVDAPTEEKKIEYALSDNDRAGKYEADQLANLIGNFPDVEWGDFTVDIKDPELVSDLMDSFKETIEDEPPELSSDPPVSKLGEIYQLGRHRVMCGDSTKIEDVTRLMDGKKADMVFTDPPYGMDLDTDYSKLPSTKKEGNKTYSKVIGDNKQFNFQDYQWLDCVEQVWFGANYYAKTLPDGGSWIVWDKRVEEKFDKMFGSGFEIAWSKTPHKQKIYRHNNTLFGGDSEARGKEHPTQKPTKLCAEIITDIGNNDDLVLDLFLGSGSTLIACEQTNRTCYGMELDPKYVDVIRKRYAKFINKEAEWEIATPVINR